MRLRRDLTRPFDTPRLPPGLEPRALWQVEPVKLHRLLEDAYRTGGGSVAPFEQWFFPLVEDEEFDPALVLTLVDKDSLPAGLVQCWTSGFIKDLVVRHDLRGRGAGSWLLLSAFQLLRDRGLSCLDLKVWQSNTAARLLYARHGMVEVL
nr:GNAT family N-acetyltransferase [Devosia oryzisoli]